MQFYVCGAHTDVGKTHFSALFCEAFGYDYFKLIQAGAPTDSDFVAKLSPKTHIFAPAIFLQTPASPHIGQRLENIAYNGLELSIPQSERLVIETAGGLFTPLDSQYTMIDYIAKYKKPCILVGKYYVGVINHLLLSLEALRKRKLTLIAIVMMRDENMSEKTLIEARLIDEFIEKYTGIKSYVLPFFNTKDFKQKAKVLKVKMQELIY